MELNHQDTPETFTLDPGDDELLATLDARFTRRLETYFRNWHFSAEAVQESVQETFSRVIAKVRGGGQIHKPAAFVLATAKQVAHEEYRRQKNKRQREESLDQRERPGEQPDPESALLRREWIRACVL